MMNAQTRKKSAWGSPRKHLWSLPCTHLRLFALVFCACLLQGCFDGGGGSGGGSGGNAPPANAFSVSGIADVNISMAEQIEEDSPVGTIVGITVFASDEDRSNNRVRYELTDSDNGRFAVDGATGVVTLALAGGLSISASPRMIEVQAISIDGSTSTRSFAITVLPPNRYPVGAISDTNSADNSFLSTAQAGDEVGITVFAEDMDGADVRYTLTENPGNIFTVDAQTGVLSLNRSAGGITGNTFMVTVLARSQDDSTSTAIFMIGRVENLRPMLDIQFPGVSSFVTTETIHIRGAAASRSGGSIDSVRAVQMHVDVADNIETAANYDPMEGTWILELTLVQGTTEIEITALDSGGMSEKDTMVVAFRRITPNAMISFVSLQGGVYDAQSNRVFVVDGGTMPQHAVVAVHVETGQRKTISGGTESVGDNCDHQDLLGGIALDTSTDPRRILVTDNSIDALVAIDIESGDCSVVSRGGSSGRGSGNILRSPLGVTVDVTGGRAFVSDTTQDAIIAINLVSGDRTTFAEGSNTPVVNTSLTRVSDLEWDTANNRLVVVDADRDAVLAVSASGEVTVLSPSESGSFGTPRGIVLHTLSGTPSALVANDGGGPEAVFIVNLMDGSRRTLVDFTNMNSNSMGLAVDPRDVVIDTSVTPPRAIVIVDDKDTLVFVDLATGVFMEQSQSLPPIEHGSGTRLMAPTGLALDSERGRLLISDSDLDAILTVDLSNGDREIFSDDTDGTVDFTFPRGLGLDLTRDRLLVIDSGGTDALFAVNIDTGSRSVLARNGDGASTLSFGSPRGNIPVIGSGVAAEALVADTARNRLFGVTLSTGVRRAILTDGTLLDGIQSVALDPGDPNIAIISAASSGDTSVIDAIFSLPLDNPSAIEALASTSEGSGPTLTNPRGIALDGQRVLVLDADLNQIIVINRSSKVRTAIETPSTSVDYLDGAAEPLIVGGMGSATNAIALDAQRQVLYVVNGSSPEVIVVDLISGHQAVISR
jgi:hypothetical protein